MTDLNLELNILQYSKEELEELFNLKNNYKFEDIHKQASKVKNTIFNIESIDDKEKNNFLLFKRRNAISSKQLYSPFFPKKISINTYNLL